MNYVVQHQNIGIMGTGSNMFRSGWAHSSGKVFVGTYGPPPAIVWQYDDESCQLTRVGAPGEYQLDCMVEAPNGKIYIGTAYNGLVYELDPTTGAIRDLGSPPVDSTPWIFTMLCTRDGEIYGAKGVGLFHLDWRTGKMENCGLVPGLHTTPPHTSGAITRTLEERPDGLIWGDTNRWIFSFDPKTRRIVTVADMALVDDACYALIHGQGIAPVNDLYFQVYSRFSGKIPRQKYYVCRAATGAVEPLPLHGLDGYSWINGWWQEGETPRLLITHRATDSEKPTIAVVDIENVAVVDRWAIEGNDIPPVRIDGHGLWFISGARGTLYRAEPEHQRLKAVAVNPIPVECRSLAISKAGRLGTDTYDCGFVFTRPAATPDFIDHGRVWIDDHRCNYGPAAFAGGTANGDDEYFLANHGEAQVVKLWATELKTNRHWRIGESAIQLVRLSDGSVWGTEGPNPPAIHFDPVTCWAPAWQAQPGTLFGWQPAAEAVETFKEIGEVGALTESAKQPGRLFLSMGHLLRLFDTGTHRIVGECPLSSPIVAVTTDYERSAVYFVLENGTVYSCRDDETGNLEVHQVAAGFGSTARGCFILPASGRLVGLAGDGSMTIFDPATKKIATATGPAPLPAGPAVSRTDDKWYFADRQVMEYSLVEG